MVFDPMEMALIDDFYPNPFLQNLCVLLQLHRGKEKEGNKCPDFRREKCVCLSVYLSPVLQASASPFLPFIFSR